MSTLNNLQIFNRICEALEVRNAAEVARKLDITEGSVSQWKKTGKISLKTFLRISDLSNASVHWLLTGEGAKSISRNVTNVSDGAVETINSLAGISTEGDTVAVFPTDKFVIVPVPLIGTISANSQKIKIVEHTDKEPLVNVSSILVKEDTRALHINGNELAAEGLHDGDILLVRKSDGQVEGKPVVAVLADGSALIRRYHRKGSMVHFSALEEELPVIRVPHEDVTVRFIVTSITRLLS